MRPLLPIITPMPGHITTVGTGLSALKPVQVQSVGDAFVADGGSSVPERSSCLPKDWQKNLAEKTLYLGANQTAHVNKRIIERVIKSNQFSDKQKAFFYYLGTDTNAQGDGLNLYDLLRVARKHPHNRHWVDPIISEQVPYNELFDGARCYLPYKENASWVFARKTVFDCLGIDPNTGEQAGQISHVTPEWQKIMHVIGDFYAKYLSVFPHYATPFYFMMEQWLTNGFGPLPEGWVKSVAKKLVLLERGRNILDINLWKDDKFDRHFSCYPHLNTVVREYFGREYECDVTIDGPAITMEQKIELLLALCWSNNRTLLDSVDKNALNTCLNSLDELTFILEPAFYTKLLKFINGSQIPNDYQVRLIVHVYNNSADFKQYVDENFPRDPGDGWHAQWLFHCIESETLLPPLIDLDQEDITAVARSLCTQMQGLNCLDYEPLAYALEAKGYFPGSLENIPRQSFGAMLLLRRLPMDVPQIGSEQFPQSTTLPLEADTEPQYLRVVHEFEKVMLSVGDCRLRVDSYYQASEKIPLWPKQGSGRQITLTAEGFVNKAVPEFIPFRRQVAISGSYLFDFVNNQTDSMEQVIHMESAPGEHDVWDEAHYGFPALASRGDYEFKMKYGARASVVVKLNQVNIKDATNIAGSAQIKSSIPRKLLWPWLEKILLVYARKQGWRHPTKIQIKDYKKWIEAVQEVIQENFAYREDLSTDLMHEAFRQGWDGSAQQLWQHAHHSRRVPSGKLAIGSDAEQSLIAVELMRYFGVSCEYAFGIRVPRDFEGKMGAEEITAIMHCQPLVHGQRSDDEFVEYTLTLLQQREDDDPVEKPKPTNFKRLEAQSKSWLRRFANAALLAGGLVLLKSCVDVVPQIPLLLSGGDWTSDMGFDFSGGASFMGGGENKPHYQPYPGQADNPWSEDDISRQQAAYRVEPVYDAPMPVYLGARFIYDFSGLDAISNDYLHDLTNPEMASGISLAALEIHPNKNFFDLLSQIPRPRTMIGYHVTGPYHSVPRAEVMPAFEMSRKPHQGREKVDPKLLEVNVPIDLIEQDYDLSEARGLSIEEKINWVQTQISESMIYDTKPNLDPEHVAFVKDWDFDNPDQLIQYWEHIHDASREITDKHPGQCNEIGFTAVQLGRALDIPMIFSFGYLVHEVEPQLGYTSMPHNQPLVVWTDESGHERMYPMMLPTDNFDRQQTEQKESQMPQTSYGIFLFMLSLLYWAERRRLKKRNDVAFVISRVLGKGDDSEESTMEDVNAVYKELIREIPIDKMTPLRLRQSGFRAPETGKASVLNEVMAFMAHVVREQPRGKQKPDISDWDGFLRNSFYTGEWRFTGNSNPPLFTEKQLGDRLQKRCAGYAEKMRELLDSSTHGLSEEAHAMAHDVVEMYLSHERPEIDVIYDD
jgi:hypothetical protein